jgi:hypothetical protein
MRRDLTVMAVVITMVLVASSFLTFPLAAQTPTPTNAAQRITYGDTVEGEIAAPRAEVVYMFSANEGDEITISMDVTGGDLDPFLILLNNTRRNVLAVDDNSGTADAESGKNALLRYTFNRSGDYLIKALNAPRDVDHTGSYTLTLTLTGSRPTPTVDPNAPTLEPTPESTFEAISESTSKSEIEPLEEPTSEAANTPEIIPIRYGATVTGEVADQIGGTAADIDYYSFSGNVDDEVTIRVEEDEGLDVILYVYVYSGDQPGQVASEMGSIEGLVLSERAVYLIIVMPAAGASGEYELTLSNR